MGTQSNKESEIKHISESLENNNLELKLKQSQEHLINLKQEFNQSHSGEISFVKK